jgi:predicted RNA binding protein YcfA (HicA-like mRNA interferase family)
MPKLYSSDHIIRILLQHGFVFISQKGSHAKYRKTGNSTLTVIVPAGRKEMPHGTFNSILKQSGLRKTDFENQ